MYYFKVGRNKKYEICNSSNIKEINYPQSISQQAT